MKKIFLIATVLFSVFCLISCNQKSVGDVMMTEAETFSDATISGYIIEVGPSSLTVCTDINGNMVFCTIDADMSRAMDCQVGDNVTVFYLPAEDENALNMATMVEVEHIEHDTNNE
jgi:hypothetical protein